MLKVGLKRPRQIMFKLTFSVEVRPEDQYNRAEGCLGVQRGSGLGFGLGLIGFRVRFGCEIATPTALGSGVRHKPFSVLLKH